jgi:S1-C subfamily serine protease
MSSPFAVKASEIDKNLTTSEEKTVVNIVRRYGPSIAFVTSSTDTPRRVLRQQPQAQRRSSPFFQRQKGRRHSSDSDEKSNRKENTSPLFEYVNMTHPLGSGSAFFVCGDGNFEDYYLVTNFHVIERAYEFNQALDQMQEFQQNATESLDRLVPKEIKDLKERIQNRYGGTNSIQRERPMPRAKVEIRTAASSSGAASSGALSKVPLVECSIVDVKPAIDVAVLRVLNRQNTTVVNAMPARESVLPFGSSSDLLVGQSLIAIGNPFGLDRTVTTGVVSALNRKLPLARRSSPGYSNGLNNCIQTDAAINPGNSGGPLLNYRGEVVGVNTAIISTTGSSAGIGFAVPMDEVKDFVSSTIRTDQIKLEQESRTNGVSAVRGSGYLGWGLASDELMQSLKNGTSANVTQGLFDEGGGVIIVSVQSSVDGGASLIQDESSDVEDSDKATVLTDIATDVTPLAVQYDNASKQNLITGDQIVAVGGTSVKYANDVETALAQRVANERLDLTLQDMQTGAKRVVYVKLARRP